MYGGIERHDFHHVLAFRARGVNVYVVCRPESRLDNKINIFNEEAVIACLKNCFDIIIVSKIESLDRFNDPISKSNIPVLVLATETCVFTYDFSSFNKISFVAFNRVTARKLESLNYKVYQQIPFYFDLRYFEPSLYSCGYYCWIGRLCQSKRPDLAINLFKALRREKLIMIGPIHYNEHGRESVVNQLIDNAMVDGNIMYLPAINDKQKCRVISRARALIYTVDDSYHECFGLAIMESLLLGTPVLALNNGKISIELIKDGFNGFICPSMSHMKTRMGSVSSLDREEIARDAILRFGPEKNTDRWLGLIENIIRDA